MKKYNQGDIVYIDFQYIDKKSGSKPRPCLVISNKSSNGIDGDILVCPITSTIRLTSFSVIIDNKDLSRSLPKECEIRTNKVFTYASKKVLSKHGEIINTAKLEEIINKVISAIKC